MRLQTKNTKNPWTMNTNNQMCIRDSVYLVAIFSNATGKLCSRTTVSIGSPIGLVNLPNDVYIIKVYNYRGQECGSFSAIKK